MSTAVYDLQGKITRFLTDELGLKNERAIVKIELEHAPQGCRAELIKEWTRENDAEWFAIEYVERLAAEIVEMAEERADIYRVGENVFKVRAFQHIGTRRAYPFKVLPVHDSDESAIIGNGSGGSHANDANAGGVLAMQMRNNEFLTRTNRDLMAGTIASLQSQNKDLLDELREVRAENRALIREANQNRAAEAERELAVVKQSHAEGRKDQLVGKVIQLMPAVAASLVEKTQGASTAAETMLPTLLAELGSSLMSDPRKIAMMRSAMSIEEQASFAKIMQLAAAATAKPSTPSGASAPSTNGTAHTPGASTT